MMYKIKLDEIQIYFTTPKQLFFGIVEHNSLFVSVIR